MGQGEKGVKAGEGALLVEPCPANRCRACAPVFMGTVLLGLNFQSSAFAVSASWVSLGYPGAHLCLALCQGALIRAFQKSPPPRFFKEDKTMK